MIEYEAKLLVKILEAEIKKVIDVKNMHVTVNENQYRIDIITHVLGCNSDFGFRFEKTEDSDEYDKLYIGKFIRLWSHAKFGAYEIDRNSCVEKIWAGAHMTPTKEWISKLVDCFVKGARNFQYMDSLK